jgi:hypothetical protein
MAFVDAHALTALSEAIGMLGLSRALLTLLIAFVAPYPVGPTWADPAKDPPFFVKRTERRLVSPLVSCTSGKTTPHGPHSAVRG